MTFEDFKKEVKENIYNNINKIADMAIDVEDRSDVRYFAELYLASIEYQENEFINKLKEKGVEINNG